MEAAKHVEKVRVNPGNYADRKKFQVREYTDSQYEQELERLHEAFSPLVLRCSELGRSMRIGTNHGSLSDRILNRFGDTPRGMAESALEFVRIARSHGFEEMILSMKASNPKVMIEAYRLVVSLMNEEGMNYPLHLGVTEAGDGEDARIKSAIGIGSLLLDGLGDTIRVSLTEDPVAEIPVARDLVRRAEAWWSDPGSGKPGPEELVDPFSFSRRPCGEISLSGKVRIGDRHPPVVLVHAQHPLEQTDKIISEFARAQSANKDAPIEGLVVHLEDSFSFPTCRFSWTRSLGRFRASSWRIHPPGATSSKRTMTPSISYGCRRRPIGMLLPLRLFSTPVKRPAPNPRFPCPGRISPLKSSRFSPLLQAHPS